MIIEHIGIEKLQISQQMKKRIQLKIVQNTSLREKDTFIKLETQTKNMKAKDTHSWEDLEGYQQQLEQVDHYKGVIEEKNKKLEERLIRAKTTLSALVKSNHEEEVQMESKIKNTLRVNN